MSSTHQVTKHGLARLHNKTAQRLAHNRVIQLLDSLISRGIASAAHKNPGKYLPMEAPLLLRTKSASDSPFRNSSLPSPAIDWTENCPSGIFRHVDNETVVVSHLSVIQFLKYRPVSQAQEVPWDSGGVYFFRLRFPSDYELGIDWGTTPPCDIATVASISDGYFKRGFELFWSRPLIGEIVEIDKAAHLQSRLDMRGTWRPNPVLLTQSRRILESVQADPFRLKLTLFAIRETFEQLPAVYIGMSSKQSLRDRLLQHVNGQTGLAERLLATGFSWNDLTYFCLPLPNFGNSEIRDLEKLLQSIVKPSLSLS